MKRTFPAAPRLAERILRFLYSQDYYLERAGDLEEDYADMVEESGLFRAKAWFWFQIFKLFYGVIRKNIVWEFIMFKNYLKIAFRNITKYKTYSFINITGLAVGIACTILILIWIQNELSYDRFHENANNIYIVAGKYGGKDSHTTYMPDPLTDILKNEIPEIINLTSYKPLESCKLETKEKSFICSGSYVDPTFFEIFSFPLAKGNPKTVFSNPYSIVISEETAQKLFRNDDPIGKIIGFSYFGSPIDLTVSGVIKNLPQNSHIQFDFLLLYEIGWWEKTWENHCLKIYVLLHKKSSHNEVSTKIAAILNEYHSTSNLLLHLYPIKKIYLYPLDSRGPITSITIFSILAFFILLIACINFMNLSTARSTARFKEIGIKKVVGSSRLQLIKQFLSESILLSFLALFLAVIIVLLLLPSVNNILDKQLKMNLTSGVISGLIGIALLTGIISGSYPAFFLSSFHPVGILKRQFQRMPLAKRKAGYRLARSAKGSSLRRILLIAQFSLSIFFIICITFVYKQLDFIRTKDLGYDTEHIVVLKMTGEIRKKSLLLKNVLLKNPDIRNITISLLSLVQWESANSDLNWTGKTPNQQIMLGGNWVDYDYLETFKLKMAQGRFFSREFSTDPKEACVVNEAAVKAMEMENPVGKKIIISPGKTSEGTYKIIGILKDFHTESLHKELRPFLLRFLTFPGGYMCIKIAPGTISNSINFIESKVREIVPSDPFNYNFLDEELDKLYKSEHLASKLVRYFTFLAVFVSCLGLFGLASFTVERKTKEIGVRKIMGASVSRIVFKLSGGFTKCVLIANTIAWPPAWYVMKKWMNNFAYRVNLDLNVFIISGLTALVIALLTVSYQSIKAATANPVDSLRYE